MKILFMDKVLLSRLREPARGVEIFNLRLIRDLSAAGDELIVPVHASWVPRIDLNEGVRLVPVAAGRKPFLNGLWAAWLLKKSDFDVLLLANVANGLLPAVGMLRKSGAVKRCVLIAHRQPSRRFLKKLKRGPTRAVSVNSVIAGQFRDEGGYESSDVYYGVTDADKFMPPETREGGVVRFCVLGQLDNAWKGADTAVAAFRKVCADKALKCELHLASLSNPDEWMEEGVVAHRWMPADQVTDFLQKMDVMVVPSRDEEVMRETFSQAIVQGMLCGLPVIANDLPVLTEKLDAGGGRIFTKVDELADHMNDLACNEALRSELGRQARQTALKRYVWDTGLFRQKFLV